MTMWKFVNVQLNFAHLNLLKGHEAHNGLQDAVYTEVFIVTSYYFSIPRNIRSDPTKNQFINQESFFQWKHSYMRKK